jgi:hypothetical protein
MKPVERVHESSRTWNRKSMRYPLAVQVSFRWKDKDGTQHQDEGTSRDLSESGTFVLARVCPPVGSDVELRIFFASLPSAASGLRMDLEGRVLRVERTSAGDVSSGFAVANNEVTLCESEESASEGNASGKAIP